MPISPHVANFIKPLCESTERLLCEQTDLQPRDYVKVSVEEVFDKEGDNLSAKHFAIMCCSSDNTQVCSYRLRDGWWQRIPGWKNLPHSMGYYGCLAPPTDVTALIVLAAVGRQRIRFEDELAEAEFMSCALRFAKQARVARAQAGFKKYLTVPNRSYKGTRDLPPMPHQAVATYCAHRSEAYALWMEQSTGKTYTTIMTIDQAHEPGKCQRVLLVVPKNLRLNWETEIHKFSKLRCATIRLGGGQLERANELLEAFRMSRSGEHDVVYVIVAYQSACNSETQICAYPWDWGVIDEGHYIKWHRTERCKSCMKFRERCTRRLELTGTPITNHAFDLYTQFEFLGHGWSGFTSFSDFKKFYGKWEPVGHGVERLRSMDNVPLLQERIARSAFTITKKEAMPWLPDKSYEQIGVEMTPYQREIYDQLANQLYAEIESDLADNEKRVTINNILVKLLRLTQVTSGFVALDPSVDPETEELLPRMIERIDPNPKLEELVEWLKDLAITSPESKVIIWCTFIQDIRSVSARLTLEGMKNVTYYGSTSESDRDKAVDAFNNNPEVDYFIGNPAAGGVGLNLTGVGCWPKRTDVVIFYSQDWSSTKRSQGEERPRGYVLDSVSPTGQNEKWQLRIVDFVVEDSIDCDIRSRVTDKRLAALELQDVRSILGRIIKS